MTLISPGLPVLRDNCTSLHSKFSKEVTRLQGPQLSSTSTWLQSSPHGLAPGASSAQLWFMLSVWALGGLVLWLLLPDHWNMVLSPLFFLCNNPQSWRRVSTLPANSFFWLNFQWPGLILLLYSLSPLQKVACSFWRNLGFISQI